VAPWKAGKKMMMRLRARITKNANYYYARPPPRPHCFSRASSDQSSDYFFIQSRYLTATTRFIAARARAPTSPGDILGRSFDGFSRETGKKKSAPYVRGKARGTWSFNVITIRLLYLSAFNITRRLSLFAWLLNRVARTHIRISIALHLSSSILCHFLRNHRRESGRQFYYVFLY
jgi:hypothetical protein